MNEEYTCYCCSNKSFDLCCKKFIMEREDPVTAEELMRSRYTAHVLGKVRYLIDTVHPKTRHFHSKKTIQRWIEENEWQKLEVIKSEEQMILFKAYFTNAVGKECIHVERSSFEKLSDKWYYVSGEFEE